MSSPSDRIYYRQQQWLFIANQSKAYHCLSAWLKGFNSTNKPFCYTNPADEQFYYELGRQAKLELGPSAQQQLLTILNPKGE